MQRGVEDLGVIGGFDLTKICREHTQTQKNTQVLHIQIDRHTDRQTDACSCYAAQDFLAQECAVVWLC
jgi:hypothetical protein